MAGSLGLIEVTGLIAAIAVSDTMAKTANIHIIGIENTRGAGYMTVKISGNVGAVNAAVHAGKQMAIEKNAFISAKVIARPSKNIEDTFCEPKNIKKTRNKSKSNETKTKVIKDENSNIKEDDVNSDDSTLDIKIEDSKSGKKRGRKSTNKK